MGKKIALTLAALVLLVTLRGFESERLEIKDYTKEELETVVLGKWVVIAFEVFESMGGKWVPRDNEYVIFTETEVTTVNSEAQSETYTWEAAPPDEIHAYNLGEDADSNKTAVRFIMRGEILVRYYENGYLIFCRDEVHDQFVKDFMSTVKFK